jgi:hypothetical protein
MCDSSDIYLIDVDIIIRVLGELNESWARLIEVAVGIGLLSRQVGAVCIVPIILTVVSTQAQGWVSRRIGSKRKDWTAATQKRVNTTAAVLGSIQSVKMSGTWRPELFTNIANSNPRSYEPRFETAPFIAAQRAGHACSILSIHHWSKRNWSVRS